MGERKHTTVFNSEVHRETVRKMEEKREKVHDEGQRIFNQTGQLDKMVNIFGAKRISRNAFIKNPDGTFTLVNGIKLPSISETDGTGSMGENVAKAFKSMGKIYGMLSGFKDRYQIDLSVAVVQDVTDRHPVFQMAEFESDNRAAEHVKKLIPDKNGGDSTEDYDLGLFYIDKFVETDIVNYGLKGYCFLIADEIGRGYVNNDSVEAHLGHQIQTPTISTKDICTSLLDKWHLFYIQVSGPENTTNWWQDKMGKERVIVIDNPDLLAEVQAGLVYVTETLEPTLAGFTEFLSNGNNGEVLRSELMVRVWNWLQTAKRLFGAQAKLPGYNNIPKPGDIFANLRDVWPIGHVNNQITTGTSTSTEATSPEKLNWGKF